jgi:hypothetical protein
MMTCYKLIFLFTLTVIFIVVCNFMLVESFFWQTVILILIIILDWLRFGVNKIWTEIKLLLPFLVTMLFVYIILGIVGFRISSQASERSTFNFWLIYGLNKSMIFINTILFLQFILSYICINDILKLPMNINIKKYFILGRALFVHTMQNLNNIEFYIKLMPEYQKKGLSFRQWFYLKLQLSYCIIIMILRESHLKGELIDNRIKHCFNTHSDE